MMQKNGIAEKIARVESASKAGLLANYVPAKAAQGASPKAPNSWGPAMRV